MTIRELITKYRNEVEKASELQPQRAAEILLELSALKSNVLEEIRKRQSTYNQALVLSLDTEKTVARAKLMSENSQAYQDLKEAVDANEVLKEITRSLKYFLREKQVEYRENTF